MRKARTYSKFFNCKLSAVSYKKMQTEIKTKTKNISQSGWLLGLLGVIAFITALAVPLSDKGQNIVAVGLLVVLSLIVLRYDILALPLAIAYLPLGIRLNMSGSLSLLLSFWLFDLICLKNAFWILRKRDFGWLRFRTGIPLLLAAFVLELLLSTALSINITLSVRKLYDLGQYIAIFVAIISTFRRYPKFSLHTLLEALLISCGYTALLSVIQFYSQFRWSSPYLTRDFYLSHTASLFEGTHSSGVVQDKLDNWVLINGPLRAFGSLLDPAGLGQYLILGVAVIAIYLPLRQFRYRATKPLRLNWLLVWLGCETIFLAILFTYARASWFVALLVLFFGACMWFARRNGLRWPTKSKLILGTIAFVAPVLVNLVIFSLYHYHFTGVKEGATATPSDAIGLPKNLPQFELAGPLSLFLAATTPVSSTVSSTPPQPTPTVALELVTNYAQNQQQPLVRLAAMFNLNDPSTQDRFNAWKYGFSVFDQHPIFGRGPGTFGLGGLANNLYVKTSDITPEIEQSSIQAHNMYLNFLVENGIVGLGLYLLLIGYTLFQLAIVRTQTLAGLAMRLVLLIWLIAFCADEFFDNLFLYTKNGALLFVALGLATVVLSRECTAQKQTVKSAALDKKLVQTLS